MEHLPRSRVPDPQEAPALRWGVLGPGRIAETFVASFQRYSRQRLVAVGSRDGGRAAGFAARFAGDARPYDCYDGVLADPDVDVVYVAVPHSGHAELALRAVEAGKHVLVEKPFALTRDEGRRVAEAAAAAGVFVAEAMWPRFLPAHDVVRRLLADGVLGEVRAVVADIGEYFEPASTARLFDPALGGGVRLDLGVYLVALSSFVAGPADSVAAQGTWTDTGVDASLTALIRGGGVDATLFATLEMPTPTRAWIGGTRATVALEGPFYATPRLTVRGVDGAWTLEQEFPETGPDRGLAFEAAHVAACIGEGRTESPLMPLAETLTVAGVLDAVGALLRGQ